MIVAKNLFIAGIGYKNVFFAYRDGSDER